MESHSNVVMGVIGFRSALYRCIAIAIDRSQSDGTGSMVLVPIDCTGYWDSQDVLVSTTKQGNFNWILRTVKVSYGTIVASGTSMNFSCRSKQEVRSIASLLGGWESLAKERCDRSKLLVVFFSL